MPDMKCPYCQGQTSKNETICPHCGGEISGSADIRREQNMLLRVAVVAALFIVVLLILALR
jgi:predicted nucleic acid-binding Zn ribbon protein